MGLLYGRAGRLTTKNGGFRPGQADATRCALGSVAHCRFARPLVHFIPESLMYSAPLFLRRQCDRALRFDMTERMLANARAVAGAPFKFRAVQSRLEQLRAAEPRSELL